MPASPQILRVAHCENRVGYRGRRAPQCFLADEQSPDMLKLGVGDTIRASADALEAGIRSQAIETQQQTPPQRVSIEDHAVAGAHKCVEEARPRSRLRHHVDQLSHRPAALKLRLDRVRCGRRRQRLERRDRDPVLATPQDAHLRIERDGAVELG